jgi:hypothetical protein
MPDHLLRMLSNHASIFLLVQVSYCHTSDSTLQVWFSHYFMSSKLDLPPHLSAEDSSPIILWNPKVHYHVHKSPPLVPVISQMITLQNQVLFP